MIKSISLPKSTAKSLIILGNLLNTTSNGSILIFITKSCKSEVVLSTCSNVSTNSGDLLFTTICSSLVLYITSSDTIFISVSILCKSTLTDWWAFLLLALGSLLTSGAFLVAISLGLTGVATTSDFWTCASSCSKSSISISTSSTVTLTTSEIFSTISLISCADFLVTRRK